MKNLVLGLALVAIIASTVGCANGPLRSWMRGAPCNTCNPPIGQPLGENFIGGCNSAACGTGTCNTGNCSNGAVGNGILGGIFRSNTNQSTEPPVSLPASSFGNPPTIGANTGSDFYGNTATPGQLELPPGNNFN